MNRDRVLRWTFGPRLAENSNRLAWGLWLLLLGTGPVQAEEEDAREPIVVTATRLETPIDQVGSSVTVITAEEMEAHQDRHVVDALLRVPGLSVRRDGGRPGARPAFFLRGTDSDQTLVLIDGIELHDPSFPNREPFLDHLTVDNVERIEVLRGPQSVLYGSDSIGGVINIITRKGEGEPAFSARFEAGSFATFSESASFRAAGDHFHYSLTGTRIDSKGFSARPDDGLGVTRDDERDGYSDSSLSVRLGADPIPGFDFDLYLQYLASDLETDLGAAPTTTETKAQQILFRAAPHLELLDGRWEQTLRYWLNDTTRKNEGASFGVPSRFDGFRYGFNWQHDLRLVDPVTIVSGFEYESETARFETPFAPPFRARTHTLAFYLDSQFELWDRLFLTAGLRVEDHEDFGTEVTSRVTGAFQLDETGTLFRASLGTGFKAPSLAQLFDQSFGSANPDLEPEESFGVDVGFEQKLWKDRVRFGATYFFNDLDELIVAVPKGAFVFRNENIEDVETQGVEITVRLQAIEALSIGGSYTFTDSEAKRAASFGLRKGGRLLRRPNHEFNITATARLLQERLGITLAVRYVGERDDIDPASFVVVEADDYVVVDLALSLALGPWLQVYGRVENLLDEGYQDILGFKNAGAAGYGGIRLKF